MKAEQQQRRQQQLLHPSLLPGLPDDIALDCLARVPYCFHSGLRCVCRRWRNLLTSPFFYHQRRKSGTAEALVCLVQALDAQDDGGDGSEKTPTKQNNCTAPPAYGLSLYNATLGEWHRLPPPPPAGFAVPLFAQCAAVRGKLVLMGGWDPVTFDSVPDVYVVDLVTGRRRRGAPMSAARSFFACAAVGPLVYVAGGHDNQKNALRSAEVYDPEADEWRALPPMEDERDECAGVANGGTFWVVSGYGTDSQGRFDREAECYDPTAGRWTKAEGLWGEDDELAVGAAAATAPRSSCFVLPPPPPATDDHRNEEGNLCRLDCCGERRGIREYDARERNWKVVGEIPENLRSNPCVATVAGGDNVFIVGSDGEQRHRAWVMNATSRNWTQVETPAGFTGFAYSAASLLL